MNPEFTQTLVRVDLYGLKALSVQIEGVLVLNEQLRQKTAALDCASEINSSQAGMQSAWRATIVTQSFEIIQVRNSKLSTVRIPLQQSLLAYRLNKCIYTLGQAQKLEKISARGRVEQIFELNFSPTFVLRVQAARGRGFDGCVFGDEKGNM